MAANVVWIGSPNFRAQSGVAKRHIDLHWMVGHLAGTDRIFADASYEVATNYGIEDGVIHQYVQEDDYAFGTGNTYANTYGVSIEHAGGWVLADGVTRMTPTAATHESSAQLVADIARRWGWTSLVLGVNVFGHNHWINTECPGTLDMAWIVARANQLLGQGGAPGAVNAGTNTSGNGFDYGAGAGEAAWRGIQTWLKAEWGYTLTIDGDPGEGTWSALQRYLAAKWEYTGDIDGEPGALSWSAAQRWLKAAHGYTGAIDGDPGPLTFAALQHAGSAEIVPAAPTAYPKTDIDGEDGPITWRRLQLWLKRDWGYTGEIDGDPGELTWSAAQRFLEANWGYTAGIDGDPGVGTWSAFQRFLQAQWGYEGAIDGDPGPLTIRALQRFANAVV